MILKRSDFLVDFWHMTHILLPGVRSLYLSASLNVRARKREPPKGAGPVAVLNLLLRQGYYKFSKSFWKHVRMVIEGSWDLGRIIVRCEIYVDLRLSKWKGKITIPLFFGFRIPFCFGFHRVVFVGFHTAFFYFQNFLFSIFLPLSYKIFRRYLILHGFSLRKLSSEWDLHWLKNNCLS